MACKEAKDRFKLDKAVEAEKQAEQQKRDENKQAILRKQISRRCRELLPLIDAAGLRDDERLYDSYQAAKIKDVRAWAEGKTDDRHFYSDETVVPWRVPDLRSMAKRLNTTAAALLGESPVDVSKAAAPTWNTGTPNDPGWFACWAAWKAKYKGAEMYEPDYETLFWTGSAWTSGPHRSDDAGFTVFGWYALPEPMEAQDAEADV